MCSLLCAIGGFIAFANGLHYSVFQKTLGYDASALLIVSIYVCLPMFFLGIAMPQVLHLLSNDPRRMGRDTSHALMLNNIGSIIAIVVTGFVLVPLTNLYIVTLFGIALLFGSVLLTLEPSRPRRSRLIYYSLASAALVLILMQYPGEPYHAWRDRSVSAENYWTEEDEAGLWSMSYKAGTSGNRFVLSLNDSYENYLTDPAEGTIEGDFLIAAMVKPSIKSAYSIGLGFGLEPYELLRLPEVERFDTAEISPGAIVLAKHAWSIVGGGPFTDPRFHLLRDDGRILLEHLPRTYDLIYSGTNRSFYPGSTNLYSVEYFDMVKHKLSEGGLTQQWIPRAPKHSSIVIIKSFLSVFPDALMMAYREPNRDSSYYYLLGFKNGIPARFQDQVKSAFLRAPDLFATTTIKSAHKLLSHLMIPRRDEIMKLNVEVITDDLPVVEYGRSFEGSQDWNELHQIARMYTSKRLARYIQGTASHFRNSED